MILLEAPLDPLLPAWIEQAPAVELTPREFRDLLDYSSSLPTGTGIGKRWRRNVHAYVQRPVQMVHPFAIDPLGGPEPYTAQRVLLAPPLPELWVMGEYIEDPNPKLVGIRWSRIVIRDAPARAA
jgi:hypothetical protein